MSKYFIKSDNYNWFLMEEKTLKTGNNIGDLVHHIVGCYSSVEELKKASIEKLLKINGIDELENAKKEMIDLLGGDNA